MIFRWFLGDFSVIFRWLGALSSADGLYVALLWLSVVLCSRAAAYHVSREPDPDLASDSLMCCDSIGPHLQHLAPGTHHAED